MSEERLTEDQVHEAIGQMIVHCELGMTGAYDFLSARGTLRTLGYGDEATEQVLQHIYDGGFQYCLDPHFAATHFDPDRPGRKPGDSDMVTDYPGHSACYWDPGQLKSRLESLSNVPYWVRHRLPRPSERS